MNVPTNPGRALFNLIESGRMDFGYCEICGAYEQDGGDPRYSEPCNEEIHDAHEAHAHETAERIAWENAQADAEAA